MALSYDNDNDNDNDKFFTQYRNSPFGLKSPG